MDGVVQSIKLITWDASERVARYAFNYAKDHGRDRVTAVHKANIMRVFPHVHPFLHMKADVNQYDRKLSDGLFLEACRQVAKDYPNIRYDEDLLDRVCLKASSDFASSCWALLTRVIIE